MRLITLVFLQLACIGAILAAYPWGGTRCKADEDCKDTECCVSYYIIKQCEDLKEEGGICNVRAGKGAQRFRFGRCPCAEGLVCTGHKNKKSKKGVCSVPKPVNQTEAP